MDSGFHLLPPPVCQNKLPQGFVGKGPETSAAVVTGRGGTISISELTHKH